MSTIPDKEPAITEQIEQYIETRIKLARYQAIDKGSTITASLITTVVVVLCLAITFLFGTIALALFLGTVLHSYWAGFGVVTLFYALLALVVWLTKDKFIEPKIINTIIKKFFNHQ
jgi:uncharacterized membrane protein YbhN (UPF0104 family)